MIKKVILSCIFLVLGLAFLAIKSTPTKADYCGYPFGFNASISINAKTCAQQWNGSYICNNAGGWICNGSYSCGGGTIGTDCAWGGQYPDSCTVVVASVSGNPAGFTGCDITNGGFSCSGTRSSQTGSCMVGGNPPGPQPPPPGGVMWCGDCGAGTCAQRDPAGCASVGDGDGNGVCNNCSAPPPPNPPPNGYHDAWSGNQPVGGGQCGAAGWATDASNSSSVVNVRAILPNGSTIASGQANQFRQDLDNDCSDGPGLCANVCPGRGGAAGGWCAYNMALPAGTNNTITVQGQDISSGAWSNLSNTPKSINCCATPGVPTNLAPSGPLACGVASQNVTWTAPAGATMYGLRIDDTSNGWVGNCALSQNPGDVCIDNYGSTSYPKPVVAGRQYNVWVHGRNNCGEWSAATPTVTFTAMSNVTLAPPSANAFVGDPAFTMVANMSPAIAVGSVGFSSSNSGIASVNPANDNTSAYTTSVTPVAAGSANITARAYSGSNGSGTLLCTSAAAPVTVAINANAWWQVRGGDVTVAGNLASQIPTTASPTIFNLAATYVNGFSGVNTYAGTGDFNTGAGTGTGGQKENWNVNSSIQSLSNTYDYAYFAGQIPSYASVVEIRPGEAGCVSSGGGVQCGQALFSSGLTDPNGYNWYHYNGNTYGGNLTLAGPAMNAPAGRKNLVLVEAANLRINNRVTALQPGSSLWMFVVGKNSLGGGGNVTIDPSVSGSPALEAIIVAEGLFSTPLSASQFIARGAFAAYGGFDLDRDLLDDTITPAELFEYAPEMMMVYPGVFGNKNVQWVEEAP